MSLARHYMNYLMTMSSHGRSTLNYLPVRALTSFSHQTSTIYILQKRHIYSGKTLEYQSSFRTCSTRHRGNARGPTNIIRRQLYYPLASSSTKLWKVPKFAQEWADTSTPLEKQRLYLQMRSYVYHSCRISQLLAGNIFLAYFADTRFDNVSISYWP